MWDDARNGKEENVVPREEELTRVSQKMDSVYLVSEGDRGNEIQRLEWEENAERLAWISGVLGVSMPNAVGVRNNAVRCSFFAGRHVLISQCELLVSAGRHVLLSSCEVLVFSELLVLCSCCVVVVFAELPVCAQTMFYFPRYPRYPTTVA